MAKVDLIKVTKIFPTGVKAVDNISLEIKDKELMVIVGPSGCGKTTTLRMIAGLEELTSGSIYINERLVNDIPPKDRDIAMVFQNYTLYPHMNVFENLAFALRLRGYSKSEIVKRVNDTGDILNIKHLFNRKPHQLSGGERQRVALGKAIVRKPQVFLFDEPLSNLDAKMRIQMRSEIHKLHLKYQTTIIYVTHDQTEAMTMGERIAVMRDGVIQQVGEPLTIYNQPKNKFVAGFIGFPPMNFFLGRIIKKNSHIYFDGDSMRVRLIKDMYDKLISYQEKEVILGIRAEDIYDKLFVSEVPPENIVKAVCHIVEPMGSEIYVYLDTGRHNFVAKMNANNRPSINQEMELVFDMSKAHFFDKETEEAII